MQTKRLLVVSALLLCIAGSLTVAPPRTVVFVLSLLAVFCLPGICLSTGVFCRFNPSLSLASMCLTGYFLSTLIAVAIRYFFPETHVFVLICPVIAFGAGYVLKRKPSGLDTENKVNEAFHDLKRSGESFDGYDLTALLLIMVLALSVSLPPLANIGKEYPEGRFYRAYFHTDYLKHVAVTAHLAHADIPPDNPYLNTGEPLRYYWFFYIFPAALRGLDIPGVETMDILRVVTVWGILVFCLLLYGICRHITPYRGAAFLAVFTGLFAHSYEGLYIYHRIRNANEPLLEGIGRYNVDGITRWFIGHPQIDGLYRTLIFTPQHLFALMLFTLAFFVMYTWHSTNTKNTKLSLKNIWSLGLITGLTFAFSSFIGLIGYIWLTGFACYALVSRKDVRFTLHTALSLASTLLILLMFGILYRRPDSLIFLPQSNVIRQFPEFIIYNYGPLILLFPLGLIQGFRSKRFLALNLTALLVVCMFFILFIQIQNFPTDMGIKLGLIVSIVFVLFLAIGLSFRHHVTRRLVYCLALLFILPAVPTLMMDVYNSSDASNPLHSLFVEAEDIQAAEWIRDNLPMNVRVQSDPYHRYEAFSLIPVFAERRTVAGDRMHARIFLSDPEMFEVLVGSVGDIYRETDPVRLVERMKQLDIDYMLAGRTERELYPGAEKVFENLVTPYRNNRVSVHSAHLAAMLGEPRVSYQASSLEYVCELSIPVVSFDLNRNHHFIVEIRVMDAAETTVTEPARIPVHVAGGETQEISTAVSVPVAAAWIDIRLFHVSDHNDVFFSNTFCLASKHRGFHTTGMIVDGKHGSYVKTAGTTPSHGILARFSTGVLPAGRYDARVIFPDSDDHAGDIDGVILRVRSAADVRETELTINSQLPRQSTPLHFVLNGMSDIMFELEVREGGSVAASALHLEWVCSDPYPFALSGVRINPRETDIVP